MGRPWIEEWNPDDEGFWESRGQVIARRNLVFSISAEFLGFAVWVLWSVVAAKLNDAGFHFSTGQLFTLAAVPALVGATVRFPYTFAVSRFGGRNWTMVSALLLLVPTSLLTVAVSHPGTPYWFFLLAAATAGFGGGNFASSMANISYFYPDKRKGVALGLNAAGGNIGVAVTQLVVPIVVTGTLLGIGGGQGAGKKVFLQNAGLIWVPFILAAVVCAWFFMDNLRLARARFGEQAAVAKRKQTWVMSWLYIGTFGSFIGYSAGLPLLIKTQFPGVALSIAFVGPLVGSLSRPVGGWLADRLGGARVTFTTFAGMILAVAGVIFFLDHKAESYAFAGFITMFVALLTMTGVGNGSTYRMIPMIFRTIHLEEAAGSGAEGREGALVRARKQTAAALGFIGAIGAYGGWLIPQGYGLSSSLTGGPMAALYVLIVFYVTCLALTWWYYLRRSFAVARAPSFAQADV
jgi:MFS transporter, NNP family, nitrate/nitrite transporter